MLTINIWRLYIVAYLCKCKLALNALKYPHNHCHDNTTTHIQESKDRRCIIWSWRYLLPMSAALNPTYCILNKTNLYGVLSSNSNVHCFYWHLGWLLTHIHSHQLLRGRVVEEVPFDESPLQTLQKYKTKTKNKCYCSTKSLFHNKSWWQNSFV